MNDKRDFVSTKYTHKLKGLVRNLVYSASPYILIAYLLIFATKFHGSGMSDMLSTAYLFLAFYYIGVFRKLYTKNSQILSYLRTYNYYVLFSLLVFQIPFFVCPAIPDENAD